MVSIVRQSSDLSEDEKSGWFAFSVIFCGSWSLNCIGKITPEGVMIPPWTLGQPDEDYLFLEKNSLMVKKPPEFQLTQLDSFSQFSLEAESFDKVISDVRQDKSSCMWTATNVIITGGKQNTHIILLTCKVDERKISPPEHHASVVLETFAFDILREFSNSKVAMPTRKISLEKIVTNSKVQNSARQKMFSVND